MRHYWENSLNPHSGRIFLKLHPAVTTVAPAGRSDGHLAGLARRRIEPENGYVSQDKTIEPRQVTSSKLAVLRGHSIFCDLDAVAFEQLCRYAKHATLKRGATIFSKGDPGNSLIAVISGTVKISISSPDGRSAILNLIGPGEIFGEVAVLDGQARTADATANSNCEIFVIDRREFLPFVRSQPALAMKFIELLCTRLRWTSDQVEQVILQDLPGRLASARSSAPSSRNPWKSRDDTGNPPSHDRRARSSERNSANPRRGG